MKRKLYFISFDFYPKGAYSLGAENNKEARIEYFNEDERSSWISRYNTVAKDDMGLHYKKLKSGFVPDLNEFILTDEKMKEVINGI